MSTGEKRLQVKMLMAGKTISAYSTLIGTEGLPSSACLELSTKLVLTLQYLTWVFLSSLSPKMFPQRERRLPGHSILPFIVLLWRELC